MVAITYRRNMSGPSASRWRCLGNCGVARLGHGLRAAVGGLLGLCGSGGLLAAAMEESQLPPPATGHIEFARDIKPILEGHCYKCHAGEKPKSHFLLTQRVSALQGGDNGMDILPGQSAKSPLIHYVSRLVKDMEMPPPDRGEPLSQEQIGLLRAWIDQGVLWEQAAPEKESAFAESPTVSWITVRGDAKKFREHYWVREGWNGGLEDFELKDKLGTDSKFHLIGRALRDDYLLDLTFEKKDVGFARFGWSQFRKYYDDTGGYSPLLVPSSFSLGRDLHLDTGRAWADWGLTLPRWPRMVVGYEFQYRQGDKSMLDWAPVGGATVTNNIYPSYKEISERVHLVKFDLEHEIAGVRIEDRARGEFYDLATRRENNLSYAPGATGPVSLVDSEGGSHVQGANTLHVEKQFTDWLFASGGYLYSKLDGDASLNVQTLNAANLPLPTSSSDWPRPSDWSLQRVVLGRESHVFSVSGALGPWQGFTLSLGTQNEWTRQKGFGDALQTLPLGLFTDPEDYQSQLDRSTFAQDVGLRYTKIPFTTLFADLRFQQESIGQYEEENGQLIQYLRQTDAKNDVRDFRLGFNTSPWRRVLLSAHFRRYNKESHYQNLRNESFGAPNVGYPGFILRREVYSQEAVTKLTLQLAPWVKTTFTYQWLANDYRTETAALPGDFSPGGRLLAGTYDAQVASVNATLTPWRRVLLSPTFSYQHARTVTSANDSPSVAPYRGDIYSVIASGTYVLRENTDLIASYVFSQADFAQDNFAAGLPLGLQYQRHGVVAGVQWRLSKSISARFQYGFYHFDEPSSGGVNNYNAHAVFATVSIRSL